MKQVLVKISSKVAGFVKGTMVLIALPFLVLALLFMVLMFGTINMGTNKYDNLVFDARL